jgi:branched-chain amino acid transport system ATP-binding protein
VKAKRIIEAEHRSLAAVLHGMLYVVREIRFGGAEPNFELLDAMVDYIDTFSERFHHPKEDAYLFKLLRSRYPSAAPLLDQLVEEHQAGTQKLRALRGLLQRYRETGMGAMPEFAARVAEFAAFHWDHMRVEEDKVLPLATAHLTSGDWEVIDAAFLGHTDPLLGAERGAEYQSLFRRIVDLAPRPIGKAPPR